jgi:hypothetical protein
MQALVSKSFPVSPEIERQSKRFKSQCSMQTDYVPIQKRTPLSRLKLQFPDLDEEASTPNIDPFCQILISFILNVPAKFQIIAVRISKFKTWEAFMTNCAI